MWLFNLINKKLCDLNLTCALSPSYLNSQQNADVSNLLKTSEIPLDGWASIGFKGIPTRETKRMGGKLKVMGSHYAMAWNGWSK